jgi:hypothetical protein
VKEREREGICAPLGVVGVWKRFMKHRGESVHRESYSARLAERASCTIRIDKAYVPMLPTAWTQADISQTSMKRLISTSEDGRAYGLQHSTRHDRRRQQNMFAREEAHHHCSLL